MSGKGGKRLARAELAAQRAAELQGRDGSAEFWGSRIRTILGFTQASWLHGVFFYGYAAAALSWCENSFSSAIYDPDHAPAKPPPRISSTGSLIIPGASRRDSPVCML